MKTEKLHRCSTTDLSGADLELSSTPFFSLTVVNENINKNPGRKYTFLKRNLDKYLYIKGTMSDKHIQLVELDGPDDDSKVSSESLDASQKKENHGSVPNTPVYIWFSNEDIESGAVRCFFLGALPVCLIGEPYVFFCVL